MIQLTKKSFLIFFSILAVWSITMTGCKKDDDDKTTPTKAAGYSFKENGTAISYNASTSGFDTITFDGVLGAAYVFADKDSLIRMFISTEKRTTGTYKITETGDNEILYTSSDKNVYYAVSGSIIITKIDLKTKKASGTFSFVAEDPFAFPVLKITITDGEFTDIPLKALES